MDKLIFLDTETTGAIPGKDRLVSVAFQVNEKLTHELFNPPVEISVEAQATHHITPEMVANKPVFAGSETFKELAELLSDHTLVAHNAPFDMAVLKAEGLEVPNSICTVKIARHLDAEGVIPRFGLQYLRYYLKLNLPEAVAHSANGDVLVTAALFNRLAEKMRGEYDSETKMLRAMREITQQPMLIRRFSFGKFKGEKLQDVAQKEPGYLEWLLEQKEKDTGKVEARGDDEDMIFSLRHFLKMRA
jgi:exodeoxyribonuclease X